MKKMKKTMIILGLGLGLSGMFSGAANALAGAESCSALKQQCAQGQQGSCYTWNRQNCWVCEQDPTAPTCG
jgi:hypothetical protein